MSNEERCSLERGVHRYKDALLLRGVCCREVSDVEECPLNRGFCGRKVSISERCPL